MLIKLMHTDHLVAFLAKQKRFREKVKCNTSSKSSHTEWFINVVTTVQSTFLTHGDADCSKANLNIIYPLFLMIGPVFYKTRAYSLGSYY